MSGAELREAAALMRERAEWANEGPWTAQRQARNSAYEVRAGGIGALGGDFTHPDAAHIASWHPAVALAVADWLDNAANRLDHADGPRPEFAHAVAVARAYVGDAS